jgi:hypothetical protein
MSSLPVLNTTLRIACLPQEIQTEEQIYRFIEGILKVRATGVKIVHMRSGSGVTFRTAFVEIDENKTPLNIMKAARSQSGIVIKSGDPGDASTGFRFDNGKLMTHVKITAKPSSVPVTIPCGGKEDYAKMEAAYKSRIAILESEIATLKSYSIIPVPGEGISIDMGHILAENILLNNEIENIKKGSA